MTRNRERREAVLRMVAAGLTYSEIATLLGVTRNSVAGIVCRDRATEPNAEKVNHAISVHNAASITQAARNAGMGQSKFRMSIKAELDDAPQGPVRAPGKEVVG